MKNTKTLALTISAALLADLTAAAAAQGIKRAQFVAAALRDALPTEIPPPPPQPPKKTTSFSVPAGLFDRLCAAAAAQQKTIAAIAVPAIEAAVKTAQTPAPAEIHSAAQAACLAEKINAALLADPRTAAAAASDICGFLNGNARGGLNQPFAARAGVSDDPPLAGTVFVEFDQCRHGTDFWQTREAVFAIAKKIAAAEKWVVADDGLDVDGDGYSGKGISFQ